MLLPLTIAWKLAIKAEDPVEVQKSIIEFLRQQDFAIAITDDRMEYMDIIRATSPSCELQVAKISPLGHEADLVRKVAPLVTAPSTFTGERFTKISQFVSPCRIIFCTGRFVNWGSHDACRLHSE